jgi:phasin family protein
MSEMPFGDFDMKKILSDLKIPNVNMEGLMEIHRKNMEAIAEVNRTAAEGIQELVKTQAEMMNRSMGEISNGVKDVAATNGESRVERQTEVARSVMEQAFNNVRQVGEMAMKTNTDVFNIVNNRITASVEEFKDLNEK